MLKKVLLILLSVFILEIDAQENIDTLSQSVTQEFKVMSSNVGVNTFDNNSKWNNYF